MAHKCLQGRPSAKRALHVFCECQRFADGVARLLGTLHAGAGPRVVDLEMHAALGEVLAAAFAVAGLEVGEAALVKRHGARAGNRP